MYPYILMFFVVIFYAGNILTGKAINDLPPFTIAFFRLFVAFIILFPIAYKRALQDRPLFLKHRKPFMVMTLTGVAFFNTFIYASLQFTSATNVSVLETIIPVLTVILSSFVLKERLHPLQKGGVALSFIGALWVVIDGQVVQLATIDWNIGDGIMVGAIACWAIYSIAVKQVMRNFHPIAAVFVMTGIALLTLLPFLAIEWFIFGIPNLMQVDYVGGFLYLGIFPSLLALLFYNVAVDRLGASKASVFLNFLPVVTMIGASLWLEETISHMQVIGAVGVMAGVVLTTRSKRIHKELGGT
ncbi:Threonine/homoserine efflux transporter RhtA [Halobacillus dabanensis]|uniref:Threonine/homoserine efflux transporter RhtA n=1 Tax=Halobacillus dabanensis TaxID=240302 RepID=A0A1I3SMM7_HALDA|nr:DMT family transporter [Halobacillus dabanensis]SFJ60064.1 Threonine/homoserine efflux transporter RhtA [Halobacillus dabanensis]